MDRNQVINWLRENTTREQWQDCNTLFFINVNEPIISDWETIPYDCAKGVCVRGYGKNKDAEPIHYSDVFEQPVFIDGAEYILHFIGHNGLNEKAVYWKGLNKFNGETGSSYPASDFGTKFTVELVQEDSTPPVKPQSSLYDRVVKALGNRDVPIGGEDHLVGQVAVDHSKAVLLDKVIKEFNIPVGGDVIQWLYNRTKTQEDSTPEIHPDSPFHTDDVTLKCKALDEETKIYMREVFSTPSSQRAVEGLNEWLTTMESVKKRTKPRNKYDREIIPGIYVDVYDVLGAFPTSSAAIDHAVKKLLAPGQRGVKDRVTDLKEAVSSIQREIERLGEWSTEADNQ